MAEQPAPAREQFKADIKSIGVGGPSLEREHRKAYVTDAKGKSELVQHGYAGKYTASQKVQEEASAARQTAKDIEKQSDRGLLGGVTQLITSAAAIALAPMTGGLSLWAPRLLGAAQLAGADVFGTDMDVGGHERSLTAQSVQAAKDLDTKTSTMTAAHQDYASAQQDVAEAQEEASDQGGITKWLGYANMATGAAQGLGAFGGMHESLEGLYQTMTSPEQLAMSQADTAGAQLAEKLSPFPGGAASLGKEASGVMGQAAQQGVQTPIGAGISKLGLGETSFGKWASDLGVNPESIAEAKMEASIVPKLKMALVDKIKGVAQTGTDTLMTPGLGGIGSQTAAWLDPRRRGVLAPNELNTGGHMGNWLAGQAQRNRGNY